MSQWTDAELRVIYARRYPEFHQLDGPPPTSPLIVRCLTVYAGAVHGGHRLAGWRISADKRDAHGVCLKCGEDFWATSRKVIPAMSPASKCPVPLRRADLS